MPRLSMDMVRLLVSACLSCGIPRDALLVGLPRALVATIPLGESSMTQLLHAFCDLNGLSWSDQEPHPLVEALKTAHLLANGRMEATLFGEAIGHLDERTTTLDPSRKRAFLEIATRRMKEAYMGLGCHVVPALGAPIGPFLAEHPDGRMSVVAVSYQEDGDLHSDLEVAIAAVRDWLQVARDDGEDAAGYVVLAPSVRNAERARVAQAGLHAIDYEQRRGINLEKIGAVVSCRLEAVSTTPSAGFSVVRGSEVRAAEDDLGAFFGDFRERVLVVVRPRQYDSVAFADELFRVCARRFLKQGPPAPLPIGIEWRGRRLLECACDVFARYGEPVIPMALLPVLREGVVCPIIDCDIPTPAPPGMELMLIPRVREGASERSKSIIVFSPADAAAAQRVERSLREQGCESRLARTVTSPA